MRDSSPKPDEPGLRIWIMKLLIYVPVILFLSFKNDKKALHYIALGDSYTICTGTSDASEQWPNILAAHLNRSGIPVSRVTNPSRNGFSTQNLIDYELPQLQNERYDFATLLIGVNDWVRDVDAATFHKNLNYIIEEVQKNLPDKKRLVLITIPDFGVTPNGALYGGGRDISKGIDAFNNIIRSEAKKRDLPLVDIFQLSKGMSGQSDLVAQDGLHPSAKEYALWETLIFPVVQKIVKQH